MCGIDGFENWNGNFVCLLWIFEVEDFGFDCVGELIIGFSLALV